MNQSPLSCLPPLAPHWWMLERGLLSSLYPPSSSSSSSSSAWWCCCCKLLVLPWRWYPPPPTHTHSHTHTHTHTHTQWRAEGANKTLSWRDGFRLENRSSVITCDWGEHGECWLSFFFRGSEGWMDGLDGWREGWIDGWIYGWRNVWGWQQHL